MAEPTPAEPAPASGVKRYVYIGVPIVLVVVIGLVVFWPRIKLAFKINALNTDDMVTRAAIRKELVQSPREAWIDDAFADAVTDSGRSFSVRHALVGILLERERLGSHVEPTYLSGDLDTRGVILAALQGRDYFEQTYVADPRFEVAETLRRWLARDGDMTRTHAIQIAMQIHLPGGMDLIRPILENRGTPGPVLDERRRDLLVGAIGAVRAYQDCESLPLLMEIARSAEVGRVRWPAAQSVDRLISGETPACADVVSVEDLTALMIDFLSDPEKEPRIGALTNFEMHPERAQAALEQVTGILGDVATAPDESVDRRHALHVLIAAKDSAFIARLPGYFFDRNQYLRSSLADRASSIEALRLDSCLIGLVQHEVTSEKTFRDAAGALRSAAGGYKGLPRSLTMKALTDPNGFWADVFTMFSGQSVDGATREDMVKGWFEWLAEDLGLEGDAVTRAYETKQAFWAAADRGDAQAAEEALDGFGSRVAGLFTYEEGWLAVNA